MPKCEVCGNDYDKAFTVTMKGKAHIFDSFECAIHSLAPKCAHCGCTIIGHGLATRFPKLRFAPTEFFSGQWIRDWYTKLQRLYEASPVIFEEDPTMVFRRNIFFHCFRDPDPKGLADLIGVDNIMFGSDFPHLEGLADPLSYSAVLEASMSPEDTAKVMGGNLARIMRVP